MNNNYKKTKKPNLKFNHFHKYQIINTKIFTKISIRIIIQIIKEEELVGDNHYNICSDLNKKF